jgi:hypothetical protein
MVCLLRGLHVGMILESPRPEVVLASEDIIALNFQVQLCVKTDTSPNLPDAKITFFIRMTKEVPIVNSTSKCKITKFFRKSTRKES